MASPSTWTRCPNCQQMSATLLPVYILAGRMFECVECGHEWTEATQSPLRSHEQPRLEKKPTRT
jgi:Zn ribbon nucleic-acid-binding protein